MWPVTKIYSHNAVAQSFQKDWTSLLCNIVLLCPLTLYFVNCIK